MICDSYIHIHRNGDIYKHVSVCIPKVESPLRVTLLIYQLAVRFHSHVKVESPLRMTSLVRQLAVRFPSHVKVESPLRVTYS